MTLSILDKKIYEIYEMRDPDSDWRMVGPGWYESPIRLRSMEWNVAENQWRTTGEHEEDAWSWVSRLTCQQMEIHGAFSELCSHSLMQ